MSIHIRCQEEVRQIPVRQMPYSFPVSVICRACNVEVNELVDPDNMGIAIGILCLFSTEL